MCHTCREGDYNPDTPIKKNGSFLVGHMLTKLIQRCPAPMEAGYKAGVHALLMLALLAQAASAQHWSYGWLPGGKRSVGELEATIRMMGTGGVVSLPEEASAQTHERRRPYNVMDDDSDRFERKKRFSYK
ncbi:gonadotropin-releasing hormone 3 [Syngnathoides biaculeatus]|uniref:gonadotropin-releasing hormone 3 n=1 Tax=Syngnathoides biaculeatus TaxID=300417 RepID=UPI002ADDD48D|nr:gonadotropin-releasing hormone 3 [Syngnathoides biaculeatus]